MSGIKDGMEENLEVPDFQYHFNEIRVKLQKLNIKEHKDIPDIEKISDKKMNEMTAGEKASLQFYIDKHVFLLETQKLINSKFDLIYFILTKQLKKGLSKEREKLFAVGYDDKCLGSDEVKCIEEPLCYVDRSKKVKECASSTDQIPFQQFCLPRYEVENRNMCVEKPSGEPLNDAERKNYAIHNETMRSRYHKKMTDKNFSGRWESRGGVINIPESFNEYCEFKFKTEKDNKEYTMYIVDDKGQNINLLNLRILN